MSENIIERHCEELRRNIRALLNSGAVQVYLGLLPLVTEAISGLELARTEESKKAYRQVIGEAQDFWDRVSK